MTAYEAARKWGIQTNQICTWLKNGKIVATKHKVGNKWKWNIPDDTPCPEYKTNCSSCIPSEASERRVLRSKGKRGYIARFAGTFSIWHMADFLGISCDKVRWIYDDIVAKGGY